MSPSHHATVNLPGTVDLRLHCGCGRVERTPRLESGKQEPTKKSDWRGNRSSGNTTHNRQMAGEYTPNCFYTKVGRIIGFSTFEDSADNQ